MTPNGRFVAFDSDASLVESDDSMRDIYVHDIDFDQNGVYDEAGGIKTVRVSVSSRGEPGDGEPRYPDISANGRFVTFMSYATNLVPEDTNGDRDIFLHDRDAEQDGVFDEPGAILTERVSVKSGGAQANVSNTFWSSVSGDGRFVAFQSAAPDLVSGDTNNTNDVFLRDRMLNLTTRVNVSPLGQEANGGSGTPQLSDDGRWIVYLTQASNVLSIDLNDNAADVVIYDRWNRTHKLVSYDQNNQHVDDIGSLTTINQRVPAVSLNGRFVAFFGRGDGFVVPKNSFSQIYLRDRGPRYLADIDGAGAVNVSDLLAVISAWGACQPAPIPCAADLNGDGTVNVTDLLMIISNWG